MDNVLKDKRFKHALADPRFKNVPWKDRKVKIDKRFQSMFTDKRFQIKYTVDERGRPIDQLQSENYKKYYDLSDTSDGSGSESLEEDEGSAEISSDPENEEDNAKSPLEDEENEPHNAKGSLEDEENLLENEEQLVAGECSDVVSKDSSDTKEKLKVAQKEVNKYIDEIHKKKMDSKIRDKLTDFTVDYARGVGTLISDSSSDESSSDESDVVNIEHPWGELDKDAEETNEITRRLAVCNMDWDRVTANDLMVLFHSFLPSDGVIESITIYPSEFGLARMAEEEQKGPKELVELKDDNSGNDKEPEEIEEGSAYQREKLREYQLKRLKYYYAAIVCNSKETANVLYTECDGLEYESSAMKLDLRFIGDDVTFDEKPHDICTALPDLRKYKPRLFVNTALQQGKVDLTWDETDPNRIEFSKRLLAGEEVDEDDLQAFVANSASSNEEEEEEEEEKSQNVTEENDNDSKKANKNRIQKYRDLVANLQEGKSKKRGDVEMEVTWGVASSKSKKEQVDSESENSGSSDESSGFLAREKTNNDKKSKKIKKKSMKSGPVSAEEQQRNAELELLLADDNPAESGLKHFSFKDIQKQEKLQQKKKKKQNLKNKLSYQEEDSFKINPSDERFSAIYTSHQFNIDPADPHYRKTKAMEQLIDEKLKRRKLE